MLNTDACYGWRSHQTNELAIGHSRVKTAFIVHCLLCCLVGVGYGVVVDGRAARANADGGHVVEKPTA